MTNTDQTLTNNFSAADMADQAAKGFREALTKAVELAEIYGYRSLAEHLTHIRDNPDTPYAVETNEPVDYRIKGLWFKLTCGACPEQYDVFRGDEQVAYVRLRFGRLRVDIPDAGGETVYIHDFDQEYKGVFSDEAERVKYLAEITEVIGNNYDRVRNKRSTNL